MLALGGDAVTVQQKQTLELDSSLFGLVSKELSQVWLMPANFVLHSDKNAFLGVTFCEKRVFGHLYLHLELLYR